ncbi:MAG TPA: response regulator [Kofleriaceae bacterium]|jgi:CheY-like chemotaxis protein
MARILLVNDEPDLLELMSMALENAGHVVESTTKGRAVIDIARRFRPDVIGIDWVIPDMSGADVLRELTSTPDLRAIPVVVISALERLESDAKHRGACRVLRKPFRPEQLVGAIADVLAGEPATISR